jgi:hypothetical protein
VSEEKEETELKSTGGQTDTTTWRDAAGSCDSRNRMVHEQ